MVGAQMLGRKAYLMELDPQYVDVILQRMTEFSGKDATRQDGKKWSELSKERHAAEKVEKKK